MENNVLKKYIPLQRFNKAIDCINLKAKKMKKLVLVAVAIVAVSFSSCGNKAADAAKATADSIRIADSIAAVEAAAAEAAAEVVDTLTADSAAVVAE
ncbi:hypothetical protein HMPREF1981_00546 [Bacteroides pyogenes F0041]|uniref:Uncharacterized protein n=2 Tax=Bacteroides pyogenes TaxID=310300 RepID=U2CUW4_9BACE|nr:hypothetical protein HMPREF1981_00546 [Bacteroides pyogenes F0041]MBB3896484.1 hypothetical protein [Bacteroides pyogenes]GAE23779.1 hypothetical protein JCM10003_3603 [Bacteroides pyogenes JCM 10003]